MKVNSSLLHHRNSYAKKWHFWRWKTRITWMRSTNPGQEVSHHQIFWNFPGANISIFICTSGLSQEAMIVKSIFFSFTSSSCNPLHGNSCNYYFHMNRYVLPTLQPHSPKISVLTAKTHATTGLSYRSNCKQASCRTFLNVYFMNPTCSNFISQRTHVQLSPGGQGESDAPFCGEAPCYGWLLCGSALLRHRAAYEHFSLDVELPLNSLIIARPCAHMFIPGAVGGKHIWHQLNANLAQLHSQDHWSQHGPFHRLLQAGGQTHIPFILKDIRTALSIFRQGLSHHPGAARPGQWPAQPAFLTHPQGKPYSLHSLHSFSSHQQREKLDTNWPWRVLG